MNLFSQLAILGGIALWVAVSVIGAMFVYWSGFPH